MPLNGFYNAYPLIKIIILNGKQYFKQLPSVEPIALSLRLVLLRLLIGHKFKFRHDHLEQEALPMSTSTCWILGEIKLAMSFRHS